MAKTKLLVVVFARSIIFETVQIVETCYNSTKMNKYDLKNADIAISNVSF